MSLTVQQLLADAKRLSGRLREHDQSADQLISRAQVLNNITTQQLPTSTLYNMYCVGSAEGGGRHEAVPGGCREPKRGGSQQAKGATCAG